MTSRPQWDQERLPGGKTLSASEIAQKRTRRPGLPEEYWDFLAQVGWGIVAGYMFYSGPTTLPDLDLPKVDEDFIAVGDNMAGFIIGFLRNQGDRLYGVDREAWVVEDTGLTFREYVMRAADDQAADD